MRDPNESVVAPDMADAVEHRHETTIRNLAAERQAERDALAKQARECADQALDKTSFAYRTIGPDTLLAAAQVYATLALRA